MEMFYLYYLVGIFVFWMEVSKKAADHSTGFIPVSNVNKKLTFLKAKLMSK